MIEKMKALLKENSMCVLASSSGDRPHCSLMAYVTDEEAKALYLVSLKTSRKSRNVRANPHVSLLVDTRADARGDSGSILALTVTGVCSVVADGDEKDLILHRIVQAHPHLHSLAYHPDADVMTIKVQSLLLLEGPMTPHFEEL
jgi:nitroimidazol reductase NimA-like FMN-containing flavoprotein (pyridoxamine 5'-phosphate oxidase superfamily)